MHVYTAAVQLIEVQGASSQGSWQQGRWKHIKVEGCVWGFSLSVIIDCEKWYLRAYMCGELSDHTRMAGCRLGMSYNIGKLLILSPRQIFSLHSMFAGSCMHSEHSKMLIKFLEWCSLILRPKSWTRAWEWALVVQSIGYACIWRCWVLAPKYSGCHKS